MFFKWGIKDQKIVEKTIDSALCPYCAYYEFTIVGWISYFYLYWVPVFIKKKYAVISCSQCKKKIIKETIPEDFNKRINSLAFPPYKIAPYYSGIPLILFIIYISIYLFNYDDNIQDSLFSNPKINDVYFIKYNELVEGSKNEFGYLKLDEIKKEELGFNISKLSYNEYFQSTKDLHNGNAYQNPYYNDEIKYFSKLQLTKLRENKIIKRIHRSELINFINLKN